ncbi:hypothetical protein pdam_00019697 [Pocillopora damicornis]|uniref:Uncharacterized protein n=1 Tax=Pocillopora damicornis TaxID=46731 RepID=A0A3M6UXI4_POCDA|nr:hypothetical protein pdam_00019697 [Pocillopora damicornis]
MPEFENREMIKSASQNAKALKHILKFQRKSTEEEKWGLSVGLYGTCRSSRTGHKHQKLPGDHDIEITDKWYQHEPKTVTHNKDKNIRDVPINTDRTITANRPDILIKDSVNSTCKLIDMTVPSDRNIALKEMAKKAILHSRSNCTKSPKQASRNTKERMDSKEHQQRYSTYES